MKEALQYIHETVPFFSAGQLLLSEGIQYPEGLGGNCVFQAHKLLAELRRKDIQARVIKASTESEFTGHVSVVATDSTEQKFLLDPLLWTDEPVPLKGLIEGTHGKVVLKPDLNLHDKDLEIHIHRTGNGTRILVEHIRRKRYDTYWVTAEKLIDIYPLEEREPQPINEPNGGRVYKNGIEIQLRHPKTRELFTIKLPIYSDVLIGEIIGLPRHQQDSNEFDRIMGVISELTGVSPKDIEYTFRTAQGIYKRIFATRLDVIKMIGQ